jgi:hypothetical protein
MNIFLLSYLVEEAARSHFNRHVVKMISETHQLLSTAHWTLDDDAARALPAGMLCKPTHKNHPCAVWARAHSNNYLWLASLGLALCAEYTRRFADTKRPEPHHACEKALCFLLQHQPRFLASVDAALNEHGLTEPPQCMPEQYRVPGDAVAAYRNYYQGTEKAALRWWRPKGVPVTRDDRDDYTPAWFAATPLAPQKNFLTPLARALRPPKKTIVSDQPPARGKRTLDAVAQEKRQCLAGPVSVEE